jgi:6-phosphogluconolactonase (cycloisomerase 2 family)
MKRYKIPFVMIVASISLVACTKVKNIADTKALEDNISSGAEELQPLSSDGNGEAGNRGFVYTLSNQAAGNSVIAYKRNANGSISLTGSFATGGNGTGGGLGNQGAVVINDEEDVVLAVNAGSNSISSLKMTGSGLKLKSKIGSGGTRPVSIAGHNDLVYVLNAGGSGNISGFRLNDDKLVAIPNSTRPLSSSTAGAAEISFVRNGTVLVITEKATNKIITYTVDETGRPGQMHSITSASPTPFGFATGRFGNIYVSEAVGGAANASNVSSYHIAPDGAITLVQGPVATTQSAACWVVLTGDGKYIYTTNTASNTLSSFNVNQGSGAINLKQPIASTTDMAPIDAALTDNSKYLYVLNAASHSITVYAVAANGNLSAIETKTGLPIGATGLAAN